MVGRLQTHNLPTWDKSGEMELNFVLMWNIDINDHTTSRCLFVGENVLFTLFHIMTTDSNLCSQSDMFH